MARDRRWTLANRARGIQPKGPACCALWRKTGLLHVKITGERASVAGRLLCGRRRLCPPCAAAVGQARAAEIEEGVNAWHGQGGRLLLVTRTMAHVRADGLADLFDVFTRANDRWVERVKVKRAHALAGVVGKVADWETPWNAWHGWNPHRHELWFIDAAGAARLGEVDEWNLPRALYGFEEMLADQWAECVGGVSPAHRPARWPSSVGLDVRMVPFDGAAELAGYLTKDAVHGVSMELARPDTKRGHGESLAPFEVLEAAVDGDVTGRELWAEYIVATKGQHQVRWTPGMRERVGLGAARTDEEIVNEAHAGRDVCELDETESAVVQWVPEITPKVCEAAERGGAEAVHGFLADVLAVLSWQEKVEVRRWARERTVDVHAGEHRRARQAGRHALSRDTRRAVRSTMLGVW